MHRKSGSPDRQPISTSPQTDLARVRVQQAHGGRCPITSLLEPEYGCQRNEPSSLCVAIFRVMKHQSLPLFGEPLETSAKPATSTRRFQNRPPRGLAVKAEALRPGLSYGNGSSCKHSRGLSWSPGRQTESLLRGPQSARNGPLVAVVSVSLPVAGFRAIRRFGSPSQAETS